MTKLFDKIEFDGYVAYYKYGELKFRKKHLKLTDQQKRERLIKYRKEYNIKNKSRRDDNQKKYASKNRESLRLYSKNKYKTDINYRISSCLRANLRHSFNSQRAIKSSNTIKLLGCTIDDLMIHLEEQFYDRSNGEKMSFDKFGRYGIHIDHIKPLSSFDLTDLDQQIEACHYSNLQPLWAEDNLRKSDRLDWKKQ